MRYFFYGTLAEPDVLREQLGLEGREPVVYDAARVRRARLTTWCGKYNALVDDGEGTVEGLAFWVKSEGWDDRLRMYKMDRYEVVRREMEIRGERVYGLTFRFRG